MRTDSLRTWNRPLLVTAALMVPGVLVCLVGLAVDDRELVGAPIWLKPFKFGVSILLFAGTWAWLVPLLPGRRVVRRAAWVISAVLLGEYVLIVVQVIRGRQSHFNYTTPFDAVVFSAMGVMIALLTIASIVLAIVLIRSRAGAPDLRAALRAGAWLSVAGMLVGPIMTTPRAAQVTAVADGEDGAGVLGAHSIGGVDGGPIMPVTGWNTEIGDLRVAHFLGLHALQAVPLVLLALVLLASAMPALQDVRRRARLLRVAGGAWFGLFAITLWQALRGQALVRPDTLTWTAVVVWALAVTAATVVAWRQEERS